MHQSLETEAHKLVRACAREMLEQAWLVHEHRSGQETEKELLDHYLKLLEAFEYSVIKQRRAIAHFRGEPVKPMVHIVEAVVSGAGGGGTAF